MKKFEKVLSLLVALSLVVCAFAACGGNKAGTDATTDNANAAPGAKLKIGIMQFGEFDALQKAAQGFIDGLAEAGYKDGEKITIHTLSAAADTANCPSIADTLINEGSDLILAIATPSVSAIKEKTSDIPVLFTAVTDPAGSGLVASNDAPGANITGTSDMNPVKEQIDLIKEIYPDAAKVAVMYCSSESNSAAQYELAKAELEALGLECVQQTVAAIDEVKSAIESLQGKVDAIYIPTDNTLADSMTSVAAAAKEAGLGIIAGEPGLVADGALATYGIDYYELGKQTAEMAVKVLQSEDKAAACASMPVVYQVEQCKYAKNDDTAAALNVTLPESINWEITYPAAK
ncbi:MAG: ABC transporter substrate-binding protein [Clostridia bacterium]|nr:ABC transporter substrate-binding protein [Clostridia bacterium]